MKIAAALAFLVLCIPAGALAAGDDCTTVSCVEALAARARVSVAARTAAEFAAAWSRRSGADAEVGYVFPDGTYGRMFMTDEWPDFRVIDMGRWTVAGAVLTLLPDAQTARAAPRPLRYVALRSAASAERFLVPFETLVARAGTNEKASSGGPWLTALRGLSGGEPMAAKDVGTLRKSFMRRIWSGGYVSDATDETVQRSRARLTELIRVVDAAERVEALPVTMSGLGLSSTPRVEEKPVRLDATTGRAVEGILTSFDWDGGSSSACMFEPAVAFRFHKAGRWTQVLVCFECSDMVLYGLNGPLGGRKGLGVDRRVWLRAAQRAFPLDAQLQQAKP